MLIAAPAGARTISVPDNAATIKGAMLGAQAGDIVLVACGTYHEYDIQIKPGVTLWSGTLQPGCVTIDPQGQGRAFIFIDADSTTALVGFTIQNGRQRNSGEDGLGGGILCLNSSPRITNCILQDNTALRGGAFYCDASSLPVVENCLFTGNGSEGSGGAIYWLGAGGKISACSLRDNHAQLGAGIFAQQANGLQVTDCHLLGNEAGNAGGGIFCRNSETLFVNCVLADNWAGLGGGGLTTVGTAPVLRNCTLVENDVEFDGAALSCIDTPPHLQYCIVANHERRFLRADGDLPTFTGCNLHGNTDGDWTGPLATQAGERGNFSRDPMFCAPNYGNYYLDSNSLCLPENRGDNSGGTVGALGVGCGGPAGAMAGQRNESGGFRAVRAQM